MATVHPSRLALVPQDPPKDLYSQTRDRRRSPSPRPPRRRSPSPRERERRRGYDRSDRRDRDRDDARRPERGRARADDYFDEASSGEERPAPRKRSRSRSVDRERDREREERRERDRDRQRRASPEYSEYRRPTPPREGSAPAPWRQQENMYTRGRDVGRFVAGDADFMESRRQQRENSSLSIWPPSPRAPTRDLSEERNSKRHKKSHKRRYDSDSDTDTDSEEERRRRRKERKKSRKEKKEKERERSRERPKHKHRSRSRLYSDEEDSEEERERRRRKDRYRSATRTRSPEARPPTTDQDDDEWVEKSASTTNLVAAPSASPPKVAPSMPPPAIPATSQKLAADDSDSDYDDDEVGPKLPPSMRAARNKVDERQYGGALLRGEGSAMAAFLKDGTDTRIPRRGEIGLASDEIAAFESVGYVMSGSRHRRMNAVRMRKENQVISAEEKRGILKLQQEERERRETILREEFQQLVDEKLKTQGGPTK